MIDIWMIRYNNPKAENKCAELIREHTTVPYRFHEYDNWLTKTGVSTLWNRFVNNSQDLICLINSDAFVSEGWLEELLGGMEDGVAAVGPSGNIEDSLQGKIKTKEEADKHGGKYQTIPYISGYCMLIKKTGIEFPEEIPFYHNEIAWQQLTERAGYKSVWAKGSFVEHAGASTAKLVGNYDWLVYAGREQYTTWSKKL